MFNRNFDISFFSSTKSGLRIFILLFSMLGLQGCTNVEGELFMLNAIWFSDDGEKYLGYLETAEEVATEKGASFDTPILTTMDDQAFSPDLFFVVNYPTFQTLVNVISDFSFIRVLSLRVSGASDTLWILCDADKEFEYSSEGNVSVIMMAYLNEDVSVEDFKTGYVAEQIDTASDFDGQLSSALYLPKQNWEGRLDADIVYTMNFDSVADYESFAAEMSTQVNVDDFGRVEFTLAENANLSF